MIGLQIRILEIKDRHITNNNQQLMLSLLTMVHSWSGRWKGSGRLDDDK